MLKKAIFKVILACFLCASLFRGLAFSAGTPMTEYLCELGATFYRMGKYEDALAEFRKVLMLEPDNPTARKYINNIFQQERPAPTLKKAVQKSAPQPQKRISRNEAIEQAFRSIPPEEARKEKLDEKLEKTGYEIAGIKISGEAQARFGVAGEDAVWKRANFDLNERNYRRNSDAAFNRRENTYDPRIYDRLMVNLDTENKEGINFHGNIMVDPWSFTGRSENVNLVGSGGDIAQIKLKYWSNTGYTINQNVGTTDYGDIISLPELKIVDGHTQLPISVTSGRLSDVFTLPEIKIYREFQPVREFWVDYTQDNLNLRVYPTAYENQALTFDDPLRLSNNRIWWEDSPWLHGWKPGQLHAGLSPEDFTQGYWDKSLSFFARDSEGRRLTTLRGFSFDFKPQEGTSLVTSLAAPRNPWQEYSDVDNFLSATRLKQSLTDAIDLGLSLTTRVGFNLEDRNKFDAYNGVVGTDVGYEIINGIKSNLEVAYSQGKYDLSNTEFRTKSRGYAYYASLVGRFPFESIMNIQDGFDGIQPNKEEKFFTKFRLLAARMDDSFDPSLSSYVETRDDEWYSRHLHFRAPFKYYYQGEGELLTWDDIKNDRIGNGIDLGRSTLGLRIESSLWDNRLENLFDLRNVHSTNNKFLENVARDEFTWQPDERLSAKFMGIYHRLPKTKAGIDPYIFDPRTREFLANDQIIGEKDPSVATGSVGLQYAFFNWLDLNGIYEYTNDISLGYDNYPRTLLKNDTTASRIYYEDNNKYRDINYFLYSQQFFPKPPYPYYNVFKTGLRLKPLEKMEVYLDYTRNPFEKAGSLDDNMNHVAIEFAYSPTNKLSFFIKYSYSRWQDLDKLVQGITKLYGHHNVFAELIYRRSPEEDFTLQYGELSRNPYMGDVLDMGWDPYGGSLETIDIQHIVRLYYRRKF